MLKTLSIYICFIFATISSYSIGGLELTLKGGLTIPNDEFGKVYNSEEQAIQGDIVNFRDAEAATGYTVGIKAGIPVTDWLTGYAHIGIHQTGEEEYRLYEGIGNNQQEYGSITASTLVIPVGAGAEIHFLEVSIADLYGTGQVNFNYLTSDVQIVASQLDEDVENTNDARLGYGLGVGSNFDLKIITVNTELLYQAINPVLADDSEDLKYLVSLTVGIMF